MKVAVFLLKALFIILLPFLLLIRGAVQFYHWGMPVYLSLALGTVLSFVAVYLYITYLYTEVFGWKAVSKKTLKVKAGLTGFIVLMFVGYTLLYVAKGNAKDGSVKNEFWSLHPFLRIGLGGVLLADPSLLITDLSRTHADYAKMGMEAKKNSMHYPQKDGYVHAMDLRTVGRSWFRNFFLKLYFQMMGFGTLRHGGTADHLHISFPTREQPNAL